MAAAGDSGHEHLLGVGRGGPCIGKAAWIIARPPPLDELHSGFLLPRGIERLSEIEPEPF